MKNTPSWDLSSFALHLIAMAAMLCDHLWATIVPGNLWMTAVGRIAFPIFAFFIAEGYFHTGNFKKYLQRMLVFALLSEIPFNLMSGASWLYPFGQNVLWTFLFALLCLGRLDQCKAHPNRTMGIVLAGLTIFGFMLLATITLTDYMGYGVLTVVLFYAFRGTSWKARLGQLAGMVLINWVWLKGMVIPLAFGLEIPIQSFAILALPLLWCYRGRQGPHNKAVQYAFYAFYPVHLLILGLLSL